MKTRHKRTVLAVDDDDINLMIIIKTAQEAGYQVKPFASSEEAMAFLKHNPDAIDIALLDKMMPVISGIDLLKYIKGHKQLRHIPVIIQTGDAGVAQMQEGLENGAFYYLTKPFHPDILKAILHSAESDCMVREDLFEQMAGDHMKFLGLMQEGEFTLRTHAEARLFAAAVSRFSPNPELAAMGLMELLANAIEHGNMEIGYDRKCQCLWTHTWVQEMATRMERREYNSRAVRIHVSKAFAGFHIVISDEGTGFDWEQYMHEDRPVKLNEPNGRGIAKALVMLHDVQYVGRGNEVHCYVGAPAAKGTQPSAQILSHAQPERRSN